MKKQTKSYLKAPKCNQSLQKEVGTAQEQEGGKKGAVSVLLGYLTGTTGLLVKPLTALNIEIQDEIQL